MNEKSKKYIDLFRKVKIVSAATVDSDGHPRSRIIEIMISTNEGMYIVTSRGKPFHKQLREKGEISLSAMCPDWQSLKFLGKCKIASKEWVDEVFIQNPNMRKVYPGNSRSILDAFLIYEGNGEWFDLSGHPIIRETFEYGDNHGESNGFEIQYNCIGCGKCVEVCPQKCIKEGTPYIIEWSHCLQCGNCFENCPVDAIKRLHQ